MKKMFKLKRQKQKLGRVATWKAYHPLLFYLEFEFKKQNSDCLLDSYYDMPHRTHYTYYLVQYSQQPCNLVDYSHSANKETGTQQCSG